MKKFIIILSCILLVLVLAAGGYTAWLFYTNIYSLDLTMEGPSEITLHYGETFTDDGAHAVFYGTNLQKEPLDVPVTRLGQVDTGTVGEYILTYKAEWEGLAKERTRLVRIIDTKAPTITLVSDPNGYTLPGHAYEEEGFTAADEYDGDITDRVIRTEKDGVVTYTVTDSSGNEAQAQRTILYDDPVAPELTLLGDATVYVKAGGTYQEPGFTALDNCDGDLTGSVTVSGGVDVYAPGTYTITYTVTDSYENTATAERSVVVDPLSFADLPAPNGKVIYLTFDDGPGPGTPRLLDILAKYNVKASFFLVNTGYIGTCARIAQEGHTVAIHSATHNFSQIYASEDAYFSDLYRMQSIIQSHTGQSPALIRFPGGSSNTVSRFNPGIMTRLTSLVEEKGFKYFDWNVDSCDAGGASSAYEVFQNVVNGVSGRSSSVVLQHDIKGFSIDAVERIIIWGLTNGYTFKALDFSSPGCHHGTNN